MPWSGQNGGGGWKPGGGPWGQGPGSGGGPGGNQPDLEEMLKRSQDRLKKAMPQGSGSWPIALLLIIGGALAAVWYGFLVRVEQDQLGVVTRFGKYHHQLPPGLNFRWPYPIEEVQTPLVTTTRTVEVGMRGSRDRFGRRVSGNERDIPEESLMLTGDENIVDVDFIVQWQVDPAKANEYLFNVYDPEKTVKEVAESAIREVVGRQELLPILSEGRALVQAEVQKIVQATLDRYKAGVLIIDAAMQNAAAPGPVKPAFSDITAAEQDNERFQRQADSYRNNVIPEARGVAQKMLEEAEAYKAQAVLEASGEAERFKKVYEEYKKAPDVTRRRLYLETMERVMGGMDKIIIDDKGGTSGVVPYLPLTGLGGTQPEVRQGGQR